ncbi:MAG: SpoIIE family protein phosphatase [Spirochaetes bacterium]|nr:SpoIIE family protein phosphatase [Spirochaetota bacterium]
MRSTPSKNWNILIVDDEPQVLSALRRELVLSLHPHTFNIITAQSADECIEKLQEFEESTFLVISDLRMPGIKGSDLLVYINTHYPDVVLMLLTAYGDLPEIQKAVSASIFSLIFKPWSAEHLASEIKSAYELFLLRKRNQAYLKEIQNQIEIASEFQRNLIASEFPRFEGFKIDVTYEPAPGSRCSGDFFDIFKLGEHKALILLADVTGHGIKPAFITAMLKVLSTDATKCTKSSKILISDLVNHLNTRICASLSTTPDVLVTFLGVILDLDLMKLTVSNAGHLPVYILRGTECLSVYTPSTAMGFDPSIQYTEDSFFLERGDTIVFFTDGLIESEKEHFKIADDEVKLMLQSLQQSDNLNRDIYTLFKSYYKKEEDYSDDVTIISIRV